MQVHHVGYRIRRFYRVANLWPVHTSNLIHGWNSPKRSTKAWRLVCRYNEAMSLSNLQVLNAIRSVAEQGCKWRGLPRWFGKWHTVYTRMNRWAKNGVLDRVFAHLQREQIMRIKLEAVSLDSTIIKVHPDGTGARKKRPPGHRQISGRLDHQTASGCRGCSHGSDLLPLTGPSARRAGRPPPPHPPRGRGPLPRRW